MHKIQQSPGDTLLPECRFHIQDVDLDLSFTVIDAAIECGDMLLVQVGIEQDVALTGFTALFADGE